MNIIDQLIGVINPTSQLKRMVARRAVERLSKRGYDGAQTGRRTGGWTAGSTSADAEIAPNVAKLRNRCRDLVRNDPFASKTIRILVSNVIGSGIHPDLENQNTSNLWDDWALEPSACDADGCLDFYGIQQLVARTLFESGECLIRFRHTQVKRQGAVPLQLQVLEPDYLDSVKFEKLKNGGYIQYGIEYDANGGRVAYWMFKEHPGGHTPMALGMESVRVPAEDVIHVYRKLRPGQARGVPILTPSMMKANDLSEYEEATLVRKAAEACITAVVQTDDGDAAVGTVSTEQDGRRVEELSPGTVEYLGTGESITFNNPPASTGDKEFVNNSRHAIAAGWGVTYEQMTGDLSEVNYSSIRAGMLDFRREVEQTQDLVIIPMFCRIVIRMWARKAELIGKRIIMAERVRWTKPRFDWVDPSEDIKSETDELVTGRKSFSRAARERGITPEQLLDEIANDRKMFEKKGVPYPYDIILEKQKSDDKSTTVS